MVFVIFLFVFFLFCFFLRSLGISSFFFLDEEWGKVKGRGKDGTFKIIIVNKIIK